MLNMVSLNIELSSICNKKCWICGRREREKLYGDQNYGFMDMSLVVKIAQQIPAGTLVQLHNNGEPLCYPEFGKAVKLFKHCITNIVSNGKDIVKKADEIIGNLDILSISIIQDDDTNEKYFQMLQIEEFLKIKGDRNPHVILRFVGNVDEESYRKFGLMHVNRALHLPKGSVGYTKPPVIPEHGICNDLLCKPCIDRFGNMSLCVRFDPDGLLRIGNINYQTISECFTSEKRKNYINMFAQGRRNELPFCGSKCEFWGVPTSK